MDDETPTRGERAADKLRNGMGSWRFIFGSLVFLAIWITVATNRVLPIDNPQLTILNLLLSCLAALQGGILLIAARRQDQLSTRTSEQDLALDTDTQRMVKAIYAKLVDDAESTEPLR